MKRGAYVGGKSLEVLHLIQWNSIQLPVTRQTRFFFCLNIKEMEGGLTVQ